MIVRFVAVIDIGKTNAKVLFMFGWRLFLDWSQAPKGEPNLTYNARYLHALQIAARLTGSEDVAAQAHKVQAAIKSRFFTQSWHEIPQGQPACQLSLALLILTDTVSGDEAAQLASQITARSLDLDDSAAPEKLVFASPFMNHYIFQALDHLGQIAQIHTIIQARWGRWAVAGEPTTWENWDITFPDGSACHAFSAHPLGWLNRSESAPSSWRKYSETNARPLAGL